ncbi:GNAT family N-acetyltransferase [Lentibacillus sediminis]|uniref:GNAT family N-acetyltransferase n=1 Tax=Lentibacillus sediminis TaxID=1940529 RepID=UPI00117B6FD2|nr:GNAT family N-acetyltransferase [Lentibacillus sediminis]
MMISKIKYYIKLAIKKPYLILSFIYKKHLGVIISIPINDKELPIVNKEITTVKSDDANKISNFYKRMNRDSVDLNVIKSWLDWGNDCFLVYYNEIIVGGMWVFKNEITLNNTSGRTISSQKTLKINGDTLYGGNVIIDENYRGNGINQYLLHYVIKYYAVNSDYKNMFIITGASNGAYIRSTMKCNGRLIGIAQVRNILGIKRRKEIFLDKKEKTWDNSEVLKG